MKHTTPLKIVAVWSLIPSYMLAGGGIGWAIDRWLGTFPLIMATLLMIGFSLAIRDMLKLRKDL